MKLPPDPQAALTASTPARRFRALAKLPDSAPAAYAVRSLLAGDPSASVRAAALGWLARSRHGDVARERIAEALDDPDPGVRAAAARGLATRKTHSALPDLMRRSQSDTVWWVRRAALLAAVCLDPEAATEAMIGALDDPFWRVRQAALAVLQTLGADDPPLRARCLADPPSPSAAGRAARVWLAARWAGYDLDLPAPDPVPAPQGDPRLDDPDPAVVAARAEALDPSTVEPAVWGMYLGDPHDSLRRIAARRLRAVGDLRVLGAVVRWLDDPRVPYGWEAAARVLRGLPRALLGAVIAQVLAGDRPAALAWALATARSRGIGLDPAQRATLGVHPDPAVRAATAGPCRDDEDLPALAALVDDPSPEVIRAAVEALVAGDPHPAVEGLLGRALGRTDDPRTQRLVARWALAYHHRGWLQTLSAADDPEARATALLGRVKANDLTPAEREAALGHPDPWVRAAVIDRAHAAERLVHDPDVVVRRAAWNGLYAPGADLRAQAARAGDPWLRAAAWRGADLSQPGILGEALAATGDRAEAVRRAVRGALEATPGLPQKLDVLLATADDPEAVIPALTWRLRGPDAVARLVRAWEDAQDSGAEAVQQHLATVALTLDDPRAAAIAAHLRAPEAPAVSGSPRTPVSRRALGTRGITLAPWILSGAHELPPPVLETAWNAGVDTFFWEPGYRSLRLWLARKGDRAQVVTGSYEASPRALRRDVERALRALGRERLEVFLLFWVRSGARLSDEALGCLQDLQHEGKLGAVGVSTHHRALAAEALAAQPWDVVMLRHSAAHPAAETEVFPVARARGRGVLAFSAMSYGRLVRPVPGAPTVGPLPTAADCYRFALADPAVAGCVAAPRTVKELVDGLQALHRPALDPAAEAGLRAHGGRVRAMSRAFNAFVRMPQAGGLAVEDSRAVAEALLDASAATPWSRAG